MTRLQKKCLIAVAGTHLLVIVAILCSGFIRPAPPTDNTTVLDVIPAILVEDALAKGVKNAQTPPPTPMVTPTPPAPAPTPVVQPPPTPTPTPPAPTPAPTIMERVVKMFKSETPPPQDSQPADLPEPKKQPHKIEVSLTPVVHNMSKTSENNPAETAREEKRLRDERRKAIAAAARAIKTGASSATPVDLQGDNSASSASYGAAILSVYYHAWTPPDNMKAESAVVSFTVTIARDGTVISAHIVTSSGDASIDRAVQQMLDRVTFIAPFPEDSKYNQRSFPIDFDAARTSTQ